MNGWRSTTLLLLAAASGFFGMSFLEDTQPKLGSNDITVKTPYEMQWVVAPLILPASATYTLLSGDPNSSGPFVVRLRVPAGYTIPPHSTPADVYFTVLSGTLFIGVGDTIDKSRGRELPEGSFARIPAMLNHYDWAPEETVIQIHGEGPWSLKFVNKESK